MKDDHKRATRPADVIESKQAPNFSESFSIINKFDVPTRVPWPSIWPPTKASMLVELYGAAESYRQDVTGKFEGKGLAVFDPEYTKELIQEGLVRELPPYPQESVITSGAVCLTEEGKQASEMLQGLRKVSDYRLPDWIVAKITELD